MKQKRKKETPYSWTENVGKKPNFLIQSKLLATHTHECNIVCANTCKHNKCEQKLVSIYSKLAIYIFKQMFLMCVRVCLCVGLAEVAAATARQQQRGTRLYTIWKIWEQQTSLKWMLLMCVRAQPMCVIHSLTHSLLHSNNWFIEIREHKTIIFCYVWQCCGLLYLFIVFVSFNSNTA